MAELNLDLAREFPKPLTVEAITAADVVVTMGCGDFCPVHPGKRYFNWELDDPADQNIDAVRSIRNDIETRVKVLLRELLPADHWG